MRHLSLAGVVVLVTVCTAEAAAPPAGVEAVTQPSGDVTLKFVKPGRVAAVEVAAGDRVQEGDVLARLDDDVERLELERLKAAAENRVHVEAAEAQVAQRKADLKKLEWAGERGAATEWEIEHARLDVTIGEMSVAKAEFDLAQAGREYQRAKAALDRMRLVSPIDGVVERRFIETGEAVQALEEVVRVVRVDPLWIDVPVPLAAARALGEGAAATVRFPGPKGEAVRGKVIHVSAVGDAAAETLTVRVEAPNEAGRPAGERVRVQFGQQATGNRERGTGNRRTATTTTTAHCKRRTTQRQPAHSPYLAAGLARRVLSRRPQVA
ncbi:MAG: efflux RND transporter periplasmic adaptor subunit, partial [Phycisphaerae bacterium]